MRELLQSELTSVAGGGKDVIGQIRMEDVATLIDGLGCAKDVALIIGTDGAATLVDGAAAVADCGQFTIDLIGKDNIESWIHDNFAPPDETVEVDASVESSSGNDFGDTTTGGGSGSPNGHTAIDLA